MNEKTTKELAATAHKINANAKKNRTDKLKCFVITVSERFPTTHKRKGQPTNFVRSIKNGDKIHTIRGNYPFWSKRIKQVQEGTAYLSVRVWTGIPYKSKQREIIRFDKSDNVGVQRAKYERDFMETAAKLDGLSIDDFNNWFKDIKPKTEMAIIHFTEFRYTIIEFKTDEK